MAAIGNARSIYRENKDLDKLPWLANPLLKFVLAQELQELRIKDSWDRETGRSSKTLAKHPDFRIVLVAMKAHTQMKQHRAEGRISIYQLLGNLDVRLPDKQVSLSAGELLVLDGGVVHDLETLEESAFLLTISWRDGQRNGHHIADVSGEEPDFDERALLRLEDEGAPNTLERVA